MARECPTRFNVKQFKERLSNFEEIKDLSDIETDGSIYYFSETSDTE